MKVLPIKFISESDQPLFGANLFNLAKLERCGLPVVPGIVVSAPEIVLGTILEHFQSATHEVYSQCLELAWKKLIKIPIPPELSEVLKKRESFFLNGKFLGKKEHLWKSLLETWLAEIGERLWRHGFVAEVATDMSAQAVFFVGKQMTPVDAHFDPDIGDVVISSGRLEPKILQQIDQIVLMANKKLYLPQVYQFLIIKDKVWLVGAVPFTQTLPVSRTADIIIPKKEEKYLSRLAIKVFFNLSQGFILPGGKVDGVFIEGEKISGFEDTIFRLADAALAFPDKPVIFRLPDICDGDIRGALRLLQQKSSLDKASEVFLFVRNKKNLLNVELGIPLARSSDELVQIKQELAARGIHRKGTLKFWLEMAVSENLINVEDYLVVGIDGVVLNLDELQRNLGGYDVAEGEFYKKQVQSLIKFIGPAFKVLHKSGVPVLASGELCLHPDVLDCLIENGVWGMVANTEIEAESLPEHLHWSERRMAVKKFA